MVATIQFKRDIINICIFCIIISKFGHKKKSSPVVLCIIDKNLEIGLYNAVSFLNLAISLSLKDDKKLLLDF